MELDARMRSWLPWRARTRIGNRADCLPCSRDIDSLTAVRCSPSYTRSAAVFRQRREPMCACEAGGTLLDHLVLRLGLHLADHDDGVRDRGEHAPAGQAEYERGDAADAEHQGALCEEPLDRHPADRCGHEAIPPRTGLVDFAPDSTGRRLGPPLRPSRVSRPARRLAPERAAAARGPEFAPVLPLARYGRRRTSRFHQIHRVALREGTGTVRTTPPTHRGPFRRLDRTGQRHRARRVQVPVRLVYHHTAGEP